MEGEMNQADPSPDISSRRPTRVRYGVLGFAMALAVITYLHRVCLSQAKTDISLELHLTNTKMGSVFSAFTLAYALFEVPLGWWGDRLGPRVVLTTAVLWWSIFTAATGAAWNFISLLIIRFLFGAGQAGAFPNLSKAFRLWLTPREQSWSQGLLWLSARWGGAMAPGLAYLAMQFLTWRWTMALFSLLGVIWVVAFRAWFRNHPREHPGVNAAELALLPQSAEVMAGSAKTPWRRLWASPHVWLLCGQYFCQSVFFYFLATWLPTYLRDGRGLKAGDSAWLAGIPMFVGGLGCLGGGLLLRWLTERIGARLSRRIVPMCALTAAAASVLYVTIAPTTGLAIAAIGFAACCNDFAMAPSWITCLDIGGRFAGTLGGQMNMWGALGGFCSPILIGWLLDLTGQNWNVTFYIFAGIYALAAVFWAPLDTVTPLEKNGAADTG